MINPDLIVAASTWTETRLIQEIEILLDEGWSFSFEKDEDLLWCLTVRDGSGTVVHTSTGGYPNVVLLSGYAWATLRAAPPSNGVWSTRKEELTVRLPTSMVEEGPEDLDPEEVVQITKLG